MVSPWAPIGNVANVTQLVGLDAITIIAMIIDAAENARMHKKNCRAFAEYLELISNLLVPLNISELRMYPETSAPLDRLEDVLRRSHFLVSSCRDRSFPYLLAKGWIIKQHFRKAEVEIERYLKLIPLITLVDLQRVRGRREIIERDQPEASPDEGTNVQDASPNLGRSSIESERSRKKMITSIKRWAKDSLHKFFKPKKGSEVGVNYDSHHLFVQPNVGFEVEVNYGASFRIFSLSELKRATKGFASNNIVGRGEFTVVYEGMLDSIAVAVKKWAQQSSQGSQEWENEMNILQNMSHPNLIRLLGYCQEEGIVLLVYEFMANRSLEHHLLERRNSLTWNQRIKIAIGTARALNFLHTSEKRIIHRGLKPGVILLDSDFNAKLSGLGWSRDGPAGEDPTISTQVLGVPGYLDPRYIMTGHLDTKTDVYAFGIILLQMLSGRKVFDVNLPVDRRHIVQFAKPLLSNLTKRVVPRLMDPKLNGQYKWKDAFRLAQLSECCVSNDVKKRPNVVEIVKVLESVEH